MDKKEFEFAVLGWVVALVWACTSDVEPRGAEAGGR